jgi:3-hydroxyacyl-CoA dehydrogenase
MSQRIAVLGAGPMGLAVAYQLARDGHYETQERLMTRIVEACARYLEIEAIEIGLKKLPVRSETGSLGVKLFVDSAVLNSLRMSATSA